MDATTSTPWGFRAWNRHSLVLVVAGMYYIAVGISLHYYVPNGPRWVELVVAREWMPLDGWTLVFISCGLAAVLSSRWPTLSQVWGYMLLTGLSSLWSGIYLMGILFRDVPESSLSAVFAWGLVAFMWWAISGLVSPVAPSAVVHDGSS